MGRVDMPPKFTGRLGVREVASWKARDWIEALAAVVLPLAVTLRTETSSKLAVGEGREKKKLWTAEFEPPFNEGEPELIVGQPGTLNPVRWTKG